MTGPINFSRFQGTNVQDVLNRLDTNQDKKITKEELEAGVQRLHEEQGVPDLESPDRVTDGELVALEFDNAEDRSLIMQALERHATDPTSPLINFEQPAAVVDEPVTTAETENQPAAPLSELPELETLNTGRAVLRDPQLRARLEQLEGEVVKGITALEAERTRLGDQAPAALTEALTRLRELQTKLRSSDPSAVQQIQQFLLDNNGARTGDDAFAKRLEYPSPQGPKTADNLYGKRTDACLRDYICELVNTTAEAARGVTRTEPAVEDPVPAPDETTTDVVSSDETVAVDGQNESTETRIESPTSALIAPGSLTLDPSVVPNYGFGEAFGLNMPITRFPTTGTGTFDFNRPSLLTPGLNFGTLPSFSTDLNLYRPSTSLGSDLWVNPGVTLTGNF